MCDSCCLLLVSLQYRKLNTEKSKRVDSTWIWRRRKTNRGSSQGKVQVTKGMERPQTGRVRLRKGTVQLRTTDKKSCRTGKVQCHTVRGWDMRAAMTTSSRHCRTQAVEGALRHWIQ